MSQILSEESKKIVYKEVKELTGIKCDICKKILLVANNHKNIRRYYSVTTGHYDWGNDSHESIVYRDICPECINEFVKDYLGKANGSEYIEIETEYVYKKDVSV